MNGKEDKSRYLNLRIPEHLRIGQSLYLFLSYCYEKGYMPLGDPFNTPDIKFVEYYNEWLKRTEENYHRVNGQQ